MKFLDKGYSKAEVDGICGKSESKSSSKWITPTNSVCKANGGQIDRHGTCEAPWIMSKDICHASNLRLPTINELKKVIVDCGVEVEHNINNKTDLSYKNCYNKKGFSSHYLYWSSTTYTLNSLDAYFADFNVGNDPHGAKTLKVAVLCFNDK